MCDSKDSDFKRSIRGSRLFAADSTSSAILERFFDLSIYETDISITLLARPKRVVSDPASIQILNGRAGRGCKFNASSLFRRK